MKTDRSKNPMEPRCGAKTRAGTPCRKYPMANGRCRLHGGCSTGPRTAEGLARLRAARTKHGAYNAEARKVRDLIRALRERTKELVELS
jgi:hypothetical protein